MPPNPLLLALRDIKLAHSVFALPFAVLATFLGAFPLGSVARFAGQIALIVACMVFARTWAMLVNRIADWRFDRENPRTAGRAIASGRLAPGRALGLALASAGLFVLCCAGFLVLYDNAWPLALSVPVLAWIALYSFTKRFTFASHLFLGGALAVSPIAALIAIEPAIAFELSAGATRSVYLLAGFVLLWVAGFDVAYALQDLDFDRERGLHSIPARFGMRGALWIARLLHAGAFSMLVSANFPDARLGVLFWLATIGVGGVLVYEHIVLARRGVAGLPMAFFTLNGVVSVLLGVAGCIDVAA